MWCNFSTGVRQSCEESKREMVSVDIKYFLPAPSSCASESDGFCGSSLSVFSAHTTHCLEVYVPAVAFHTQLIPFHYRNRLNNLISTKGTKGQCSSFYKKDEIKGTKYQCASFYKRDEIKGIKDQCTSFYKRDEIKGIKDQYASFYKRHEIPIPSSAERTKPKVLISAKESYQPKYLPTKGTR